MTDTPMEKINGVFPVLDVSRYFAGDDGDLPRLGRELRYAFENVAGLLNSLCLGAERVSLRRNTMGKS